MTAPTKVMRTSNEMTTIDGKMAFGNTDEELEV